MKKVTILFLILLSVNLSFLSQAQYSVSKESNIDKNIYVGLGYGLGFFYPSDVNDYIKYNIQNINIITGFEEIFINYAVRVSLTYRVNRLIDLSCFAEYAWAPKLFYVDGGDNLYFHFDRVAPGLMATFHKPFGSGRHSYFLAPGLHYNFMKFEEFKANALGARLKAGLSFNFGKFNLQPFALYDYAKATDKTSTYVTDFELNYSGMQIGLNIGF